jgi:aspartate aminotransferase-like enzyme/GNAT superfamily N-acetyltransferase
MTAYRPLIYKVATEPRELEMIHGLNYRTFVEEIPQHARNPARRLVDRFHAENTYVICVDQDRLAGMVALRGVRPFSLDDKVPDLDSHLPPARKPCEIRLLAVEAEYRKTSVFAGLMVRLLQVARARGYDVAVISGTTRQLRLYRHIGFEPFGSLVGAAGAQYQPMMLTLERFESCVGSLIAELAAEPPAVSFLPGPVQVNAQVHDAFVRRPISHRDEAFAGLLDAVQRRLRLLTSAAHAAVLLGSGTLANDAVAAQLACKRAPGLVLANGEFGERLVDHARRWRLDFDACRAQWGKPFDPDELSRRLHQGKPAWLWLVHCETSTGVLNDLAAVRALCRETGTELCVDAISSVGTVEVDFRDVAFATAVSGKGLGAYPGLAIVFHRDPPCDGPSLPAYLDLRLYSGVASVPFTHSSNLVAALSFALARIGPARYESVRRDSALLRRKLDEMGLDCVAAAAHASPGIITVALPAAISSAAVGEQLRAAGYSLAFRSRYLLQRNWLQIALMGDYSGPQLSSMLSSLNDALAPLRSAGQPGGTSAMHERSGTLARRG